MRIFTRNILLCTFMVLSWNHRERLVVHTSSEEFFRFVEDKSFEHIPGSLEELASSDLGIPQLMQAYGETKSLFVNLKRIYEEKPELQGGILALETDFLKFHDETFRVETVVQRIAERTDYYLECLSEAIEEGSTDKALKSLKKLAKTLTDLQAQFEAFVENCDKVLKAFERRKEQALENIQNTPMGKLDKFTPPKKSEGCGILKKYFCVDVAEVSLVTASLVSATSRAGSLVLANDVTSLTEIYSGITQQLALTHQIFKSEISKLQDISKDFETEACEIINHPGRVQRKQPEISDAIERARKNLRRDIAKFAFKFEHEEVKV